MNIRLAQCLCPDRHCILAMMFLDESVDDTDALNLLRVAVNEAVRGNPEILGSMGLSVPIRPHCALCGAKRSTWTFEIGRMSESDPERALAWCRQLEVEQRRSAELLKTAGLAYDRPAGGWN